MLEATKQGPETRDSKWAWVEALIWTERMLAALGNGVKGDKWFSLIDKVYRTATLHAAWLRVKANHGAAGVDEQSVNAFTRHADRYLAELEEALKEGRYTPQPVKRVEIPKGPKQTRPLGIPVVKDRIVQTAVKLVIEPIFEAKFLDTSYGFRPERSAKDALREVDALLKAGYTYVVDADLKSYFDTIPHDRLRERVRERISDGRLLSIIDSWISQDIMAGLERWTPTCGTPQGAVISPLLSNCYLTKVIAELTPTLRGWFNYFKHAHRSTFRTVDGFVRRRLRALLRKQKKRPGHGNTREDHQRWPNAFFAAHGLFTLHEAHASASQSR